MCDNLCRRSEVGAFRVSFVSPFSEQESREKQSDLEGVNVFCVRNMFASTSCCGSLWRRCEWEKQGRPKLFNIVAVVQVVDVQ